MLTRDWGIEHWGDASFAFWVLSCIDNLSDGALIVTFFSASQLI